MTVDRFVLDASVAAKFLFEEEGAERARAWMMSGATVLTSDFLAIEIASVAAKKVRKGDAGVELAMEAIRVIALADEKIPIRAHLERAAQLAITHGFSVYDATYLALAEAQACFVLTADLKLVNRAQAAGLGALVRAL